MLLGAKRLIETIDDDRIDSNAQLLGGNSAPPKVIYGDTDSVFVLYPGLTPQQATARAHAAAAMVTRRLGRLPILLEFEKCYSAFCIQQIKRYVGAIHKPSDSRTNGGEDWEHEEQEIDIKGNMGHR